MLREEEEEERVRGGWRKRKRKKRRCLSPLLSVETETHLLLFFHSYLLRRPASRGGPLALRPTSMEQAREQGQQQQQQRRTKRRKRGSIVGGTATKAERRQSTSTIRSKTKEKKTRRLARLLPPTTAPGWRAWQGRRPLCALRESEREVELEANVSFSKEFFSFEGQAKISFLI